MFAVSHHSAGNRDRLPFNAGPEEYSKRSVGFD